MTGAFRGWSGARRSGLGPPRTRRPPGKVRADINVTPLVDVVLVLLIIFMVVAPIVARGVPVELPQALHHSRKADDGKDVIVSVTRDGQVYLRANRVRVEDVSRQLAEERKRSPERRVYLRGDGLASYRSVRAVMEAVRKGSVEEVMLGTEDTKPTN
jgi:biopolymer transport protein ExbD